MWFIPDEYVSGISLHMKLFEARKYMYCVLKKKYSSLIRWSTIFVHLSITE